MASAKCLSPFMPLIECSTGFRLRSPDSFLRHPHTQTNTFFPLLPFEPNYRFIPNFWQINKRKWQVGAKSYINSNCLLGSVVSQIYTICIKYAHWSP